ncbi:nuclear matrix constituent protein 1b-like isoform X1 [Typha latifolia]|uniref:nuclear matrix constituent protein 1b-like isoform X1 n=2 Tax=Typha latifolia TaxID=4733 RepID=UPI003C2C6C0D
MASPRPRAAMVAVNGSAEPSASPDEAIWKRLREAGFDEESVKRRDKAALIAYITKLESEIYDYQHHMGLLILERKEWASKYEKVKVCAESSEVTYKRERAAQLSALAEARKREESLKKALGIEKECVANIEKALHDIRAESAETKIAYENKLAEAHHMMEAAQMKLDEAEEKLLAAKSLETDSVRTRDSALRSLQDIEAREDELRRRLSSFETECNAKENEISLQRRSLNDSQKILHEAEERLVEKQALLNQRDEYIFDRMENLSLLEKKLEDEKSLIEGENKALKEERINLDLEIAALATREEAIIKRESLLDKRERELLILQETIACKEHAETRRLTDELESVLAKRRSEFECEMEKRRMLLEDEMEPKRTFLVDREVHLIEREKSVHEKEEAVKLLLIELAEKQEDIAKSSKQLQEEEQNLHSTKKAVEVELKNMQRERDDIASIIVDLEKKRAKLEDEKLEITHAQENLELTLEERNALLILETKLKEEIDSFRAQKLELSTEGDRLQAEKERFEIEWELIDEKKEELQKESEQLAEERKVVSQYLKNEHDNIKQEKENLHRQFLSNVESLSREREEFMANMQCEHANWFSKIQQEREDFTRDIHIQKKELENSVQERRAEIEAYLREREEAFRQEKAKELQFINSQKEIITMQLEHVASEMQKLNNERKEIALEREQREKELSEIKSSIEILNVQREKLQKQRELLHADREVINQQIQRLEELENSNIESENRALQIVHAYKVRLPLTTNVSSNDVAKEINEVQKTDSKHGSMLKFLPEKTPGSSPQASTPISWVRKCASVIFKRTPEKSTDSGPEKYEQKTFGKLGKVIQGNFFRSPQSDSKENTGSVVCNGNLSELAKPQYPVASTSMKSGHGKSRKKETQDGTTNTISHSFPLTENVENTFEVEDWSGTRIGTTSLGRKRQNDMISHDHADMQLEPSWKQQKRENDGLMMEAPCSNHGCDAAAISQNLGCPNIPDGFKDQEFGNHAVTNLTTTEVLQHTAAPHLEDERSHSSASSLHISDGIPLSSSCLNGTMKTQKQIRERSSLDDEVSLNKASLSAAEQIGGDGLNLKEQDGLDQDSDDEVDDEDEGSLSVKEKLWKFLIT